ncbi:MAG: endonuclease III [Chloroflexi bacterium]|nr:endonuclease III [Chloroflexota bacterium]
MEKPDINCIITLLSREYGEPSWQPDREPLGTLVQTILSQHTSDKNSHPAYRALVSAFPDWYAVADASPWEIAAPIRGGGLAEIKAKRIKQALNEIRASRSGCIELDFLNELSVAEAREWLKQLSGVGTKTASCVLLFSLGKPALPVDTHIYRVSKRLGLISERTSVEQAHQALENMVPPEEVYRFHVLLIEHGRKVCKAVRPRCGICVLQKLCPAYGEYGNNQETIAKIQETSR